MKLDDVTVVANSAPAFMGHEEIVLPMLVSTIWVKSGADATSVFHHWMNDDFEPNDLANTAVAGFMSGLNGSRLDTQSIFADTFLDAWRHIPMLNVALKGLGQRYAFFYEESHAPLQDAYIQRCRLIAHDKLPDFYPFMDGKVATDQNVTASEALAAFLRHTRKEPDLATLYGDHYESNRFRGLYGDDEQFFLGYAIWLEEVGVIRAWTRVIYVPK